MRCGECGHPYDSRLFPVKRYLLFCGEYYYPGGGGLDFAGSYHSIEDAASALPAPDALDQWAHVFDAGKGEVVKEWVARLLTMPSPERRSTYGWAEVDEHGRFIDEPPLVTVPRPPVPGAATFYVTGKRIPEEGT